MKHMSEVPVRIRSLPNNCRRTNGKKSNQSWYGIDGYVSAAIIIMAMGNTNSYRKNQPKNESLNWKNVSKSFFPYIVWLNVYSVYATL